MHMVGKGALFNQVESVVEGMVEGEILGERLKMTRA